MSESERAETFYVGTLGFEIRSAYRPTPEADPAYLSLWREGAVLHLSSFPGDGEPGASVVNLLVEDVDAIHEALGSAGINVGLVPTDQSWGTREMYIADPDGNRLRFVQERT